MCGICGFLSQKNIDVEALKNMNNSMQHRGPDDSGVEIEPVYGGYQLGLAHRRLSILDLSVRGHQPMHSVNKRVTVVFNGEIYNFQELRNKIDYPFTSDSDTEVIIAAYLKYGIRCVDYFNGMFAIAIYDRDTQELFLIRDRMGVKPLYYCVQDGSLIFGSELKTIMLCPEINLEIDKNILGLYFAKGYICSPNTIFKQVKKLNAGSVLRFKAGRYDIKKYWNVKDKYHELSRFPIKDFDEAKEELKLKLTEAVRLRMISDVPIGVFLSGGYDSSLITAIAQQQCDEPLRTFSIGFEKGTFSESLYAEAVARHIGTRHTNKVITESQMLELIDELPYYYDEPFADGSQLPMMLVAKLAKENNVTVALSGDGGDELFCGYGAYEKVSFMQKLNPIFKLGHLLGTIPVLGGTLEDYYPYKLQAMTRNRNKNTQTQPEALTREKILRKLLLKTDGEDLDLQYRIEQSYCVDDWMIRAMLLDMDTYLPDDICCKVDRATMRYSLETRSPLLDKDVIELSYRIPQRYKYHGKCLKYILKNIAYEYIPKELLDRPKQGFGIPYQKWLQGPLRERLLEYCRENFLIRQSMFDGKVMRKFIADYMKYDENIKPNYSDVIWRFLMFQMWYEYHAL